MPGQTIAIGLRFPTWHVDPDAVTFVETNIVRGPASSPIAL